MPSRAGVTAPGIRCRAVRGSDRCRCVLERRSVPGRGEVVPNERKLGRAQNAMCPLKCGTMSAETMSRRRVDQRTRVLKFCRRAPCRFFQVGFFVPSSWQPAVVSVGRDRTRGTRGTGPRPRVGTDECPFARSKHPCLVGNALGVFRCPSWFE